MEGAVSYIQREQFNPLNVHASRKFVSNNGGRIIRYFPVQTDVTFRERWMYGGNAFNAPLCNVRILGTVHFLRRLSNK